jgi:hypothetical protein
LIPGAAFFLRRRTGHALPKVSLSTPADWAPTGVRWTVGDVSDEGFEALRLSVWGGVQVFGPNARYVVCLNSISLAYAQEKTGELPSAVQWLDADDYLPEWLRPHLEINMAEGVGWKFAPLRLFPDRYEIALDNDCILWEPPLALQAAVMGGECQCVLAEDVRCCFGQFADLCGPEPRNTGIRGIPSGFDLEGALRSTLNRHRCQLSSETDEQGLQVAALQSTGSPQVVRASEVSICSPFPPHSRSVGTCGAHFVGLNARNLPWAYYGRPASEVRREHWRECLPALYDLVGIDPAG